MTSAKGRPKGTDDIFPPALRAERDYLLKVDSSAQPCVFYFRKSVGDDFATQVLRCLQYARSAGLRLDASVGTGGIYFDDDKSGMKDIARPGYDRLMSNIATGDLAGRFVVVRDQDRLSRRESSVLEEYHVITARSKVRTFDSAGREIKDDVTTGVIGVINRAEAKRVGIRQRARKEFRAIEGMTPASRVRRIGYTIGYAEIDWEEAKILRRSRNKAVAGQSLSSICRELREQGIVKRSGKPYNVSDMSRLLRDPTYAGIRVFSRDIEVEGKVIPKGAPVSKGSWPKIFTEAEHREVVQALSKNESWATDSKTKHLLAGILVCAECGTRMSYQSKTGKAQKDGTKKPLYVYRCQIGRGGCGNVSRSARALESFFLELTYEAIKRLPVDEEKVVDTTDDDIARQEKKIAEAIQAYKDEVLDISELADIKQDAQKKIDSLKKRQASKFRPLPVDDAEAFLRTDDVGKQRDTIRRFFPHVGVKKAPGPGVRFRPDQLVWPKSG